jgi:hypothetical protein
MTNTPTVPYQRKNAFFGLHFDLHPRKDDTVLGADTSEENIGRLLDRVRPDYVQYDCKGHAGYAGYPTETGWASPGIVQDALAIWRKVTRERGVGLFIHYSGVWDSVAIEHHPEWARIDVNGNADRNATSTFGPYVDELLVPQLQEVIGQYDLDGAWVDGECWATRLDYAPAALATWQQETGETTAPADHTDPRWLKWKMFHRRRFEQYLAHWVDALHAFRPGVQLASNWMYSTFAPKPIETGVDYLSGDYSPTQSVDRARSEARYLANAAASASLPWDLMAWGFNWGKELGQSIKPAVQLQQEAAVVMMQGGGFQVYYQSTRAGYVVDEIIDTMGEVADFSRARQQVSHGSSSVPQVALLLSSESLWDRMDNVYVPSPQDELYGDLDGTLQALLELHYSVDVLAEYQLQPHLSEFPLVVLPDCHRLDDGFRQALLDYVDGGGNLLLLGQQCARLFEPVLGVRFNGAPQHTVAELATDSRTVNANGDWQSVTPTTAQVIGWRYATRDTRKEGEVAATLVNHGQGRIGAVYGPLASIYFRTHHHTLRAFIGEITRQLFSDPAVRVNGPACVDVALRRTAQGKLSLHLLNLAETQRADRFISTDFVPTIGPIEVQLHVAEKPKRVRWVPDGGRLKWAWENGTLTVTVPRLHVHGVIVIE